MPGRSEVTCIRVRVTGRVQGVWFRGWTRQEAERLGLSGWVRNEADGSVAALVCGPEDRVAELCALLWQGPDAAVVAQVETVPATPPEKLSGFDIRR